MFTLKHFELGHSSRMQLIAKHVFPFISIFCSFRFVGGMNFMMFSPLSFLFLFFYFLSLSNKSYTKRTGRYSNSL